MRGISHERAATLYLVDRLNVADSRGGLACCLRHRRRMLREQLSTATTDTTLAACFRTLSPQTRPRARDVLCSPARQESYAGFMETIAAARDLGTWAAPPTPARPAHEHDKENAHATAATAAASATAVPYGGGGGGGGGSSTTAPHAPRYRPLAELPNGRGGRVQGGVYPAPPAATCNRAAAAATATAAAAVWRDRHRFGGGGGDGGIDVIRVGGPSCRRPGHGRYQRSASDIVSAACDGGGGGGGGGFAAEVAAPRRPRSGVGAGGGGGGGDGGSTGVGRRWGLVSTAEEMHLAAVAMGRARKGSRLSSRF